MAAPAVEVWRRRIEGLECEVAEVMREEREERSLRKAEQEATKVPFQGCRAHGADNQGLGFTHFFPDFLKS